MLKASGKAGINNNQYQYMEDETERNFNVKVTCIERICCFLIERVWFSNSGFH